MDTVEIAITIAGIFLSGFILWFFLFSKRQTAQATSNSGVQEITIQVRGGYIPEQIVVKKGIPVRLNFFRDETAGCSDRVVFPDFGINRELPAFQTTSIILTPDKPGNYIFTCGMNMMRGKLVVEDSE